MALIKNNEIAADPWMRIGDNEDIGGPQVAIVVSYARWSEDKETLRGHNGPLGIQLKSDEPPTLIEQDLEYFQMIALEFPTFKDGRAYSHARLLRERYGFTGELRAVGDVLRDQLFFMQRCGFDAFEVNSEEALQDWREAIREISVCYQPSADGRPTVLDLRRTSVSDPDVVSPKIKAAE